MLNRIFKALSTAAAAVAAWSIFTYFQPLAARKIARIAGSNFSAIWKWLAANSQVLLPLLALGLMLWLGRAWLQKTQVRIFIVAVLAVYLEERLIGIASVFRGLTDCAAELGSLLDTGLFLMIFKGLAMLIAVEGMILLAIFFMPLVHFLAKQAIPLLKRRFKKPPYTIRHPHGYL